MKIFKRIVMAFLVIIAVLVVVAFLLPSHYKVTRSIYINAPDSVIHRLTSNLEKWDYWTAWTKDSDSTAVFTLTGEDGKIGTSRKWNGKVLGNGEMIITENKNNQLLGYDLSFDNGRYRSKGKLIIENAGDSSKVTWTDEGDLGYNPVARYYGLMMDRMMGPDFEKGLQKLKTVAEERNKIIHTTVPEQTAILIRDSAGQQQYNEVMGKAFTELYTLIGEKKLKPSGYPFAIYIRWDSATQFSVMDIGIPVDAKNIKVTGRVREEVIPAHNVVMIKYFGAYDKTASAYYLLDRYCAQEKLEITGGPWEIYVSDPNVEKDTSKLETDIAFPVK